MTVKRCHWPTTELNIPYHDEEWGVPLHDDRALFELLILEGAQAGLSWDTILMKRARYREVFDGFDDAQAFAGEDHGIGCDEQGFKEAWISVCGFDNLLCVYAGDRDGERSFGGVFPIRCVVAKIVRRSLICSASLGRVENKAVYMPLGTAYAGSSGFNL
jgi:hypothetical protein